MPFRSSSVKAMGSSLFSRSRRDDAPKDLTKPPGDSRRRRASLTGAERRTSVANDFKLHTEAQRPTMPPPASFGRPRSPPRKDSVSRRSVSPRSRQKMAGGDGFHVRQSRSPPRRRYSSSEIPRPHEMAPPSPVPSRSRINDSHERRDRPGFGGAAAAETPLASPQLAPHKAGWSATSREARQEARRYPPSASTNNRPQPAPVRGTSPSQRPAASAERHRSASVDGYDRKTQPAPAPLPSSPSRRPKHERRGSDSFFNKFPKTFVTYAGIRALSEHADKAKEWVEWLNNVNDAPDEIRALSARITTARDTIQQMKDCLKARPDLIEDETGQVLKLQIENTIDSTSETLKKMTKLLASFSRAARDENNDTALGRLEGFWHSYNYKHEGEEQIKSADAELQQQLLQLGFYMSNIYARAVIKPVPSSVLNTPNTPTPPLPTPKVNTVPEASKPIPRPAASMPNRPPPSPQLSPKTQGQFESVGNHPKAAAATNPPTPPHSEPSVEQPLSNDSNNDSNNGHPSDDFNNGPAAESDPIPNSGDILLDAAWEGDVKTVANCIRQAPPSSCDNNGLTPLHLAVERDHMAVAMFLLDHGADVHARADGGCMPLHLAARYASAATVEMLIDRGKADPNAQTTDGRTALHYAARSAEDGVSERREVIRALRDLGANPTLKNRRGELPRDVAQKRDFWDAAATLRRAEQKWEQQQQQRQQQYQQQQYQQQQQQYQQQQQQQRNLQQEHLQQRQPKNQLKEANIRERGAKKEGSWLQRYGLRK
ncbi:hypothetical protein ACHAPX_008372 [Trichoderma viride]